MPGRINGRTIAAPAAAFTMAVLLFVYTRTSIRAATANAQRYRDADSGGEGLSLVNENKRRHGQVQRLEKERGTVSELAREAKAQITGSKKKQEDESVARELGSGRSDNEERLRAAMRGARVVKKPDSDG